MENDTTHSSIPSTEDSSLPNTSANQETNKALEAEGASLDRSAFEVLQALQEELEQQKALTLRTLADLDNYRKRAIKEKEDMRKWAIGSLLEALLPILDNFELGLKNVSSEAPPSFIQGFQMVQDQLLQILKDFGLSPVEPNNEVFNPNNQDCVAHIPHESIPENHVIQTVRKGYTLQDRLLRSASVLVSSGPMASPVNEGL